MRTLKLQVANKLTFVALSFVLLSFLFTPAQLVAQDLDVPYVPTPDKVVQRMLDMVDVQPSDYVIDLGSGDGRIVIAAAKRGASGHGIDLDPKRVKEARRNAITNGVDKQVMFMKADIFNTDFSKASVITMYLLPSVNKKLRPELLDRLEPGTKIVSHSFDMGDWKPDKKKVIEIEGRSRSHQIYYWVIPAKVEGTWSWSENGKEFTMDITQKFQEINVTLTDGKDNMYNIRKAELQGKRMTIRATRGNQNLIFSGRVEDGKIDGMMQRHIGDNKSFSQWSANKK